MTRSNSCSRSIDCRARISSSVVAGVPCPFVCVCCIVCLAMRGWSRKSSCILFVSLGLLNEDVKILHGASQCVSQETCFPNMAWHVWYVCCLVCHTCRGVSTLILLYIYTDTEKLHVQKQTSKHRATSALTKGAFGMHVCSSIAFHCVTKLVPITRSGVRVWQRSGTQCVFRFTTMLFGHVQKQCPC